MTEKEEQFIKELRSVMDKYNVKLIEDNWTYIYSFVGDDIMIYIDDICG